MPAKMQRWIDHTAEPPASCAPDELGAFVWYFIRQVRAPITLLFGASAVMAIVDAMVPVLIGRIVTLASAPPDQMNNHTTGVLVLGAIVLLVRPAVLALETSLRLNVVSPGLQGLVRWQSYTHVMQRTLMSIQQDLPGRIANRILNTSTALRDAVVSAIRSIWYILVYATSSAVILTGADVRFSLPILGWALLYCVFIRWYILGIRSRALRTSETKSNLFGQVIDVINNVSTVKLFLGSSRELCSVKEASEEHYDAQSNQLRFNTKAVILLGILNAVLITGMAALSVWLWSIGRVTAGDIAMSLPIVAHIATLSAWIAAEVTSIFDNVGAVKDGMRTIASAPNDLERDDARDLKVSHGAISFVNVTFGYPRNRLLFERLNLEIRAHERIGIVGRSGAGKSSLISLLLGLQQAQSGKVYVDGQDLSCVSPTSLRAAVGVVTQDISLFNRSIADNIRYANPSATDEDVRRAAQIAGADMFIQELRDSHGRSGYDAFVGDRGTQISGGQRQRIALARAVLKNAPILVLDEATSALDSDTEALVQEHLQRVMRGKTVIVVAHRLSTVVDLDRIVVIEGGVVKEEGTHTSLLAQRGLYYELWCHQTLPNALPAFAGQSAQS